MAGCHNCKLWMGATTQCPATYVGLAMGGISVWIKPSDWDGIANNLSTYASSVPVYHRTLGRELHKRLDDRCSAYNDTIGLKA